jgi:2-dehydropantoate 2-reductase
MRHAVLGTGGIGGLIAGALARASAEVTLLMRPATLDRYPGHLTVRSEVLGEFDVEVPAASELNHELDALWVAVKAMHLESALQLAPPKRVPTRPSSRS